MLSSYDPCTIIDSYRCKRLWRAALAQYATDCLNAARRRQQGKEASEESEDAALDDLLTHGRMLKRLCRQAELDGTVTHRAMLAWLTAHHKITTPPKATA